jgi:hypothetical protein
MNRFNPKPLDKQHRLITHDREYYEKEYQFWLRQDERNEQVKMTVGNSCAGTPSLYMEFIDLGLEPYIQPYSVSRHYVLFGKYVYTRDRSFRELGSNNWHACCSLEWVINYIGSKESGFPLPYKEIPTTIPNTPLEGLDKFNLKGHVKDGDNPTEYILFDYIVYRPKSGKWRNISKKAKWYNSFNLKALLTTITRNDRFNRIPEDYKTWYKQNIDNKAPSKV